MDAFEYYDDEYGDAVETSLAELKEEFGDDFARAIEESSADKAKTDLPDKLDVNLTKNTKAPAKPTTTG